MRIALASCSNLPGWEKDDHPFHRALEELGVEHEEPAWDDPAVDWSRFDGCIVRTTWDYMEKRADYVSWAEKTAGAIPFFNPAPVIRWNTHKSYLRELEARGVRIAPTLWMKPGDSPDLRVAFEERGWTRGFIKPVIGASARETLRFEATDEGFLAAKAHLERTLVSEEMMVQPYLAEVETFGELSLLFFGGKFSHAVRKVPVPGDYRVQDDFGASDFPVEVTDDEMAQASAAIRAAEEACPGIGAQSLLYARVDFLKLDSGELALTELELVEPSLFFRHTETGPRQLAEALVERVRRG